MMGEQQRQNLAHGHNLLTGHTSERLPLFCAAWVKAACLQKILVQEPHAPQNRLVENRISHQVFNLKNPSLIGKHRSVVPVPIALYYFLRIVFLFHSQKFGELRIAR